MDQKAENVVQNVGAMAEVTSVFYNSIIKQVPKDVALVLTQHFMDITIARSTSISARQLRRQRPWRLSGGPWSSGSVRSSKSSPIRLPSPQNQRISRPRTNECGF